MGHIHSPQRKLVWLEVVRVTDDDVKRYLGAILWGIQNAIVKSLDLILNAVESN